MITTKGTKRPDRNQLKAYMLVALIVGLNGISYIGQHYQSDHAVTTAIQHDNRQWCGVFTDLTESDHTPGVSHPTTSYGKNLAGQFALLKKEKCG